MDSADVDGPECHLNVNTLGVNDGDVLSAVGVYVCPCSAFQGALVAETLVPGLMMQGPVTSQVLSVARSLAPSVVLSVRRSVGRSVGESVGRSVGRSGWVVGGGSRSRSRNL